MRVNVLLRLRFYSIFRDFPHFMIEPQRAHRRPPGPDQPIALGIDSESQLELAINLRSAEDIHVHPEER